MLLTSKLAFQTPILVRRKKTCTCSVAAASKRPVATAAGGSPHGRGKRQQRGGSQSNPSSGDDDDCLYEDDDDEDDDFMSIFEDHPANCFSGEGYDWSGDPTDYILDQLLSSKEREPRSKIGSMSGRCY